MVQRFQETGRGSTGVAWQGVPWIVLGCPRKFCLVPSRRWACHCYPLYSYQSKKLLQRPLDIEESQDFASQWSNLYQIIKLVRYATRFEGSEGRDSCIHLPWRGSHGNYTMNMLLILLTPNLLHIHTVLCHSTTGASSEKWGLRMFRSGNIMECISQIWTV